MPYLQWVLVGCTSHNWLQDGNMHTSMRTSLLDELSFQVVWHFNGHFMTLNLSVYRVSVQRRRMLNCVFHSILHVSDSRSDRQSACQERLAVIQQCHSAGDLAGGKKKVLRKKGARRKKKKKVRGGKKKGCVEEQKVLGGKKCPEEKGAWRGKRCMEEKKVHGGRKKCSVEEKGAQREKKRCLEEEKKRCMEEKKVHGGT